MVVPIVPATFTYHQLSPPVLPRITHAFAFSVPENTMRVPAPREAAPRKAVLAGMELNFHSTLSQARKGEDDLVRTIWLM